MPSLPFADPHTAADRPPPGRAFTATRRTGPLGTYRRLPVQVSV